MSRRTKMSDPLVEPLRDAFEVSGMTLGELIRKAGLEITEASMSRKLSGDQAIAIPQEADALGEALGLGRAKWDDRRRSFRFERRAA